MTIKAAADILRCSPRTASRLVPAVLTPLDVDGLEVRPGRGPVVVIVKRSDVEALHQRYPVLPTIPKLIADIKGDGPP